ncbi:MAG: phage tail protein [Betaproteobacteria bacterium]|nr:phage tail protein [Betaproteobacteria bacterium]
MVNALVARLLPQNSTPMERALAVSVQPPWLDAMAGFPSGVKFSRPAGFAPWVASEWWLADFAQYFDDAESLIEAGLPWLKKRGTAAAVKEALRWIGLKNASLECAGAVLQIDPGAIVSMEEVAAIRQLVAASIPAHVYFRRMTHGYDIRPLGFDRRAKLDAALWDDDSGVWIDGIKLSFGDRHLSIAEAPRPRSVLSRACRTRALSHRNAEGQWDGWTFDSRFTERNALNAFAVSTNRNLDRDWTPATRYRPAGRVDGRRSGGNTFLIRTQTPAPL